MKNRAKKLAKLIHNKLNANEFDQFESVPCVGLSLAIDGVVDFLVLDKKSGKTFEVSIKQYGS